MKGYTLIPLILLFLPVLTFGQGWSQTVRGTVLDIDNKQSLIGVNVIIANTNPVIGTTTDEKGQFRLENVPTGRISLLFSYLGYENQVVPNVVVNSGKEVVVEVVMEEALVEMEAVVVTANENKGEALNEYALLSARSISPEETNRYAGGFNDPSRIMSNFAGITSTLDGSNDIIVRGNSPKYIQWRLEGVQISNPNHFADQSAVGGAVSALNNNLLASSDFYTGAFTAEYGDVLSGVYDVKLRAGNNEKIESVFGFGLLGTDFTLEGPFKKGYGGSFLVNYRYSTITLVEQLGLTEFEGGIPNFQDAAFKFVLPTQNAGTFSWFGLGGRSNFSFEDVKPDVWPTPLGNGMQPNLKEDYDKTSYLVHSGLNHTIRINDQSYLKTTIAYSREGIEDEITESRFVKLFDANENYLGDSLISSTPNFQSELARTSYRAAITYNHKLNARNKIQVGSKYALLDLDFTQSQLASTDAARFTLVDFKEQISTLRNFISWKHRYNEAITVVAGIHNMNVLYNNKHTIEPRLAVNWKVGESSTLSAGFGLHSNMESIHNYFARVEEEDGISRMPNQDLDLLKARHYVLGYEKRLGKNIRVKVEAYYQDLYNIPVENLDTSYYSTINEGLEFRYVDLVNEGKGKNYGIELTIERFFSNNFYYLINGSLFESTYQSLDGTERNTRYNGNYLANILLGKEFPKLGRKKNQTLGINAKVFFAGGKRILPLLRDDTGELAVDPANNRFWDVERAYEDKIEDVYQVILSASYKWDRRKATHEVFINLDNVTNTQGRLSEYYDEDEPGSVGYLQQFGFFPNLMYRVYF